MIYYISNELSHHGVKGQKWGVRKQRQSLGGRAHRAMAGVYGMNEKKTIHEWIEKLEMGV